MHDSTPDSLRKHTLKNNGKTLSRKAAAKTTSLAPSLAGSMPTSKNVSRASSAMPSRAPSDAGRSDSRPDSRLDWSDDDSPSKSIPYVHAISKWNRAYLDRTLAFEELELAGYDSSDDGLESFTQEFEQELNELVNNQRAFKHTSPQVRIPPLVRYARALLSRYLPDELAPFEDGMVKLLKKTIKDTDSPEEKSWALKCLALTMITLPSHQLYEDTISLLKSSIQYDDLKPDAIRTLATMTFFGEIGREATIATLTFLRDIITSNGDSIDAWSEPTPIVAAIEAWCFLATALDPLPDVEDAIKVFYGQLAPTAAPVMIEAGKAIALIYEKEHFASIDREEADEPDQTEDGGPEADTNATDVSDDSTSHAEVENGDDDEVDETAEPLYRRHRPLVARLRALSKESSKRFSATERKDLHSNFADVLACVLEPGRGPRYSEVQDKDTGAELGHRLKVRVTLDLVATITSWEEFVRLDAVKRVLGEGFHTHWDQNPVVPEALQIDAVAFQAAKGGAKKGAKKSPAEKRKARKGKKGAELS